MSESSLPALRTRFAFEQISEALELVPLAGRRALDRAGRKVGLAVWTQLAPEKRGRIVAAGAADDVDVREVEATLVGVEARAIDAEPEPDRDRVPSALLALSTDARPLGDGAWSRLTGLERWALASLARRGKVAALAEAYDEIVAPRVPGA